MYFTYIQDETICNCKPDHNLDDTRLNAIGRFSGNVRCESKNALAWRKYHGKNCYSGQGADSMLPNPLPDSLSLSDCLGTIRK